MRTPIAHGLEFDAVTYETSELFLFLLAAILNVCTQYDGLSWCDSELTVQSRKQHGVSICVLPGVWLRHVQGW